MTTAAIIGTGNIAQENYGALHFHNLEVVAAVDIDADRVRRFCDENHIPSAYTSTANMLVDAQPQIVVICTPPANHCELAIQCMEAGAWVLCEKPLCASLAEMDRIEAAETRTGCYTAVISQRRFSSATEYLKTRIDAGELGSPLVAVGVIAWYRDAAYHRAPWRGTWPTETGGVTQMLGIHLSDLLLWLFGDWQEVRAVITTLDRDIAVDNYSSATVAFANGAMATLVNSLVSPRQETYLRMDFQRGTVELTDLYDHANGNWCFTGLDGERFPSARDIPHNIRANHKTQLAAFLADYRANQRPLTSGHEARRTLEFVASVYKSAFTSQPVRCGTINADDPFYHAMNGKPE